MAMATVTIAALLIFTALLGVQGQQLRFNSERGDFRILQVADMHYANGKTTACLDVYPSQMSTCSDLNTTAFLSRVISAEKPDLIVFTGDNIYGSDCSNPAASMDNGMGPAVSSGIPWAAVVGNHDQEGSLNRKGVMQHIVGMKNTLSQLNPPDATSIDGYGNYNLEVHGADGSSLSEKSLLNLYFIDSGDYSNSILYPGYGWIKASQQQWYQRTSAALKSKYNSEPEALTGAAPGIAYFHIPLPEYANLKTSDITGQKQEGISSPTYNSGFYTTLSNTGDVKAVFVGHDHLNDFCGNLNGINLCYSGGFGYHAYGEAGWSRRTRMVAVNLERGDDGSWGEVGSIMTWKRLDDDTLSTIDQQVLWSKNSS